MDIAGLGACALAVCKASKITRRIGASGALTLEQLVTSMSGERRAISKGARIKAARQLTLVHPGEPTASVMPTKFGRRGSRASAGR
jgi:hypothetical protein